MILWNYGALWTFVALTLLSFIDKEGTGKCVGASKRNFGLMKFFLFIEDLVWSLRCSYNLWLHGPYGLAKVVEKMPVCFLIKYLRKYGATIGEGCLFERGIIFIDPLEKNHLKIFI